MGVTPTVGADGKVTMKDLIDEATARTKRLVEVTLAHSEYAATDDERRLVEMGTDLGITVFGALIAERFGNGDQRQHD